MIIVADLNSTITDRPELFRLFHQNLIVVTGTPETKRKMVENKLKKWKVKYNQLIMCPINWSTPKEYFASKQWKLRAVIDLKPDIYFDDSIRDILTVKQKCPDMLGLLILNGGYQAYETK